MNDEPHGSAIAILISEMLRINLQIEGAQTILIIEGKLIGPWVGELASCWQKAVAASSHVVVKLSGVSFIDDAGRNLLSEMHLLGTEITADECMNRSIVERIIRGAGFPPAQC